jgi:hypothetical protein
MEVAGARREDAAMAAAAPPLPPQTAPATDGPAHGSTGRGGGGDVIFGSREEIHQIFG